MTFSVYATGFNAIEPSSITGPDPGPCSRSGSFRQPVLHPQPGHSTEFSFVPGYHRQSGDTRMRRDKKVVRPNRFPGRFELGSNPPVVNRNILG